LATYSVDLSSALSASSVIGLEEMHPRDLLLVLLGGFWDDGIIKFLL